MGPRKNESLSQLKNPNYVINKTRRRELVAKQKQLLKKVTPSNLQLIEIQYNY